MSSKKVLKITYYCYKQTNSNTTKNIICHSKQLIMLKRVSREISFSNSFNFTLKDSELITYNIKAKNPIRELTKVKKKKKGTQLPKWKKFLSVFNIVIDSPFYTLKLTKISLLWGIWINNSLTDAISAISYFNLPTGNNFLLEQL